MRLQLKWFHQFQFAGYYAAIEKGYYAEAGLEVELIEGQPGMNFAKRVTDREVEYGIEMPDLVLKRNEGFSVVVLAAIFQHSPNVLLLRRDSMLGTPQDLAGSRIMMSVGTSAEFWAMFKNEGINIDGIEVVEHTWNLNILIDEKVDATTAYLTDEPFTLQERGVIPHVIRPLTYGIDFYGDCLFTSEAELRDHPSRVKDFRAASLRGWEYAMAHPEEIIDLILAKYPTKSSRENMRHEVTVLEKDLMLPKLVQIGHMNPGRWKHIADTYVSLEMLDADYDLEGFIYDPNATPLWQRRLAWGGLGVGILVTLLASGLLFFNRRLSTAVRRRTTELTEMNQQLTVEVDERVAAVRRQNIVMSELDHRVKNNLAAILSLTKQTIQSSDSLATFDKTFSGRIHAMAYTHELLAMGKWENVDLRKITEHLLAAYKIKGVERITLQGDAVNLPARAASPLSLAMYELATNASKYGAFSDTEGRLLITWQVTEEGTLIIDWVESNGPRIEGTPKDGTGTQIIIGLVEYEMQGQVTLNYLPEGLRAELRIPLRLLLEKNPSPDSI